MFKNLLHVRYERRSTTKAIAHVVETIGSIHTTISRLNLLAFAADVMIWHDHIVDALICVDNNDLYWIDAKDPIGKIKKPLNKDTFYLEIGDNELGLYCSRKIEKDFTKINLIK
jgi:hypothetical protein